MNRENTTPHEDGFRVSEVAQRLGVTPRAVRARIARGTLKAYHVPGANGPEWRVAPECLEDTAAYPERGKRTAATDARDDASSNAALRAQVEWLRSQVDVMQGHVKELTALLRSEQQRTAAIEARVYGLPLPGGQAPADTGQPGEQQPRRRWWQFGRR